MRYRQKAGLLGAWRKPVAGSTAKRNAAAQLSGTHPKAPGSSPCIAL
jgi:hypothetical protein